MYKSSHEWQPGLNKLDHEIYSFKPSNSLHRHIVPEGQSSALHLRLLRERQNGQIQILIDLPDVVLRGLDSVVVLMNHHPTAAFQLTTSG